MTEWLAVFRSGRVVRRVRARVLSRLSDRETDVERVGRVWDVAAWRFELTVRDRLVDASGVWWQVEGVARDTDRAHMRVTAWREPPPPPAH